MRAHPNATCKRSLGFGVKNHFKDLRLVGKWTCLLQVAIT